MIIGQVFKGWKVVSKDTELDKKYNYNYICKCVECGDLRSYKKYDIIKEKIGYCKKCSKKNINPEDVSLVDDIIRLKEEGLADKKIGDILGCSKDKIRYLRRKYNIGNGVKPEKIETVKEPKKYYCPCGEELIHLGNRPLKYCSEKCRYKYHTKERVGSKPKKTYVCPICNQEFEGKKNSKYCSNECRNQARKDKYNKTKVLKCSTDFNKGTFINFKVEQSLTRIFGITDKDRVKTIVKEKLQCLL